MKLPAIYKDAIEALQAQLSTCQVERNQVISQHKTTAKLNEANEEDLLRHFSENVAICQEIQQVKQNVTHAETQLKQFLRTTTLQKCYLHENLMTEWLGSYMALAYAKATDRTLRIWGHRETSPNSQEIYL